MVKKKFSLFLIASLVLSILTVLPGVSATPARPYTGASGLFDFIETCIGNSCDLIESCRSQAHTKTVAVEKEAIECFAEPGDPTPRGCYGITAKWNNHWSGGDSYVPDTDGWADDYFRAFTSECEAAKPQEAAETELQAAADEENELQAEMDLLLNEIADICVGIEGCKPGDRESPGYFNDIINSIIKLHSDSCDKGQCIKVPIDELINLADRIVDWNQREAAWESKFNGLTPEPIETKVRDVNPGILTNLYTNLNTNLKEEISKPSEQDHIAAKQVDLNKNEIFNQLNDAFTEKGKISAEQVASAIKSAIKINAKELSFSSKFSDTLSEYDMAKSIAEVVHMSTYKFESYKTEKTLMQLETIVISDIDENSKKQSEKAIFEGETFGLMNVKARELTNTIPQIATPAYMADMAKKIAKENDMSIKILDKKEMENLGMNSILAVGQGSKNEPKFVIMEYTGALQKTVALVGKGVCFDAGGLDIKNASGMETMKGDKAGAIAVMCTMGAIAKLKPKISVIAIMPFVENLVSDTSYKPSDIIKSYSGKTIEVLNTDAEGRVILADALTYAEKYKPRLVVDVATLTGACMVALGAQAAGLFTPDDKIANELLTAGEISGDYLWRLPLWEEYADEVKGTFGDVQNMGKSRYGGAITAAMFLYQFAKKYPWVHIDIAGTMKAVDGQGLAKGATGTGTRVLIELAKNYK